MDKFKKYNKFIVAGIGGIISAILIYFEPSQVPEWVNYLVYIATALGVYRIPNNK